MDINKSFRILFVFLLFIIQGAYNEQKERK